MNDDRTHGEAYEFDEQADVAGRKLPAGDRAPGFELAHLDLRARPSKRSASWSRRASPAVERRHLARHAGLPLRSAAPELRQDVADNVRVSTVSMDLPFAQAHRCGFEDVGTRRCRAYASEDFGRDYGVLLKDWRLPQRAVFVSDGDES
jgi:thioredoxin-dependent peroxiredoxin